MITINHHCCRCHCHHQVMLIAPGFVPEGGGIDWSNVTASSLLGLEPGAAVVEGQVCFLPVSCHKDSLMSWEMSRQKANSHFSLSQIVPGGPRAVWRSHPPGGEASTSWGQVSRLVRMFCIDSTCHSHGIVSFWQQRTSSSLAGL